MLGLWLHSVTVDAEGLGRIGEVTALFYANASIYFAGIRQCINRKTLYRTRTGRVQAESRNLYQRGWHCMVLLDARKRMLRSKEPEFSVLHAFCTRV